MNVDSEKARSIFTSAVENQAPDQWEAFLDSACGQDAGLRERVELLLRAHQGEDSFLDRGQEDEPADATIGQPITEKPGARIGPYKLLQQVGEGGFGIVYMAEQMEPVRRKVALKIIKPGMDTKEVIARFEAERQALAMMDHPNIARVLDAGATESGRPYFVMEIVNGVPVTEFCDSQKLATVERLWLFVDICSAVQHAHQKGVIHRDLKPTNVMVTMRDDRVIPKVIDFGVSKALSQQLTEKTLFTAYGQMVGTPLYMSPEQTQMNEIDVDIRSDIYSLGVLLYELLTGSTPFDSESLKQAGFDEIRRIIRENEPPRPSARISTLNAQQLSTVAGKHQADARKFSQFLRGELDWIVMKALEKDRSRRYNTASEFVADIQRYLNDEPVVACPPSAAYQFKKFARRNKASLTTAILVMAALILGIIGTAWQAVEANAERANAITEQRRAESAEQAAREQQQVAERAREIAERAGTLESDLRRQAQEHARRETRLVAAGFLDRAQALCEQGEVGRGIIWLAQSLRKAEEAGAADLEMAIRSNLAAWRPQLHALETLVQQEAAVRAVAFSPDSSRILTGCSDGTVELWNRGTGRSIARLPRHPSAVQAVSFSPNGSRILTGCDDGKVRLWDANTLERVAGPADVGGAVKIVKFSPNGARIVTAAQAGMVRCWDATLRAAGEPFHAGARTALRFCPNGLHVVVRRDGKTLLWDLDRGEQVGLPVSEGFSVAAVSPDGSKFVTARGSGIELWDAATGSLAIPPIVHGGMVQALSFSPDGTRLLSGGNTRDARLWDTTTGQLIGTPLRQRSTVHSVAFSTGGRRILTGSGDGSTRVWEVASNKALGKSIQHKDGFMAAALGPGGVRIITEEENSLQLRDPLTGEAIGNPFPRNRVRMRFSPDGSKLLLHRSGRHPELRDVTTGRLVGGLPLREQTYLRGYLHDSAFSPDGSRILTGNMGGYAVLWDATTMEPIGEPLQHVSPPITSPGVATVHNVAFSADGSRMLTGSYDGTTRLWDATTLEAIGEPLTHQSEVKALAYSPDAERMLTGFADGTVRLWDLATLEPIGVPLHHQEIVSGVAFSPDGGRFLTCSLDQTAQLWDTATQKPIGPSLMHEAEWPAASFSADGEEFLVSAAYQGSARLWENPPGPLEGDRERIVLWSQVITGLELDDNGAISGLDGPTWRKLHHELEQLGGPPVASPFSAPSRAETDFSRSLIVAQRARDSAARNQWDHAATGFAEALDLSGNSRTLRLQIAIWLRQLAAMHLSREGVEHRLNELLESLASRPGLQQAVAGLRFQLGDMLNDAGRRQEAANMWWRALEHFPAGPYVQYKVRINTIGQYRLYVRWDGHDRRAADSYESIYVRIVERGDGPGGSVPDWYRYENWQSDGDFGSRPWHGFGGFERGGVPGGGDDQPAVWSVSHPGDYTIRFFMREDGAAIDAFVLQLVDLPAPAGDGPDESTSAPSNVFTESQGQVVVEAEHFSARKTTRDANWLVVPREDRGAGDQANFRGAGYVQVLPDAGIQASFAANRTLCLVLLAVDAELCPDGHARRWYDQAARWIENDEAGNDRAEAIRRFRAEMAQLLDAIARTD